MPAAEVRPEVGLAAWLSVLEPPAEVATGRLLLVAAPLWARLKEAGPEPAAKSAVDVAGRDCCCTVEVLVVALAGVCCCGLKDCCGCNAKGLLEPRLELPAGPREFEAPVPVLDGIVCC